ncbi:MAG TPA: DUF2497 domain-containing protein [Caulobacteraceae bacterium]|nr:DUF2497 domain-containing protein [Caulobacteraceae bacterium]
MSDQTAPEPTMEEILASIRRIISEDDAPKGDGVDAAAPAATDDEEDDVLELTERAHEDDPAQSGEEVMAPPEPEAPPVMESRPEPYREPEPSRAYQPEPVAPRPMTREEPLISPRAATVAASAFRELSTAAQPPRESRTLEDLAREMLEPMLRQWLDENLPRIVESAVRDEVERISRSRVG